MGLYFIVCLCARCKTLAKSKELIIVLNLFNISFSIDI